MKMGVKTALIWLGLLLAGSRAFSAEEAAVPKPKLVQLDPASAEGMRILGGAPETVTMRSGSVVLAPGKSIGKHSTGTYEEALVVLSGSGEMRLTNGPTLALKAFSVLYCPPDTEHDVFNTGSEPLRYVYIVARTR